MFLSLNGLTCLSRCLFVVAFQQAASWELAGLRSACLLYCAGCPQMRQMRRTDAPTSQIGSPSAWSLDCFLCVSPFCCAPVFPPGPDSVRIAQAPLRSLVSHRPTMRGARIPIAIQVNHHPRLTIDNPNGQTSLQLRWRQSCPGTQLMDPSLNEFPLRSLSV